MPLVRGRHVVPLLHGEWGTPFKRIGLAHAAISPYGVFKTRDGGDVLISIQNDREWRILAEHVMGDKALAGIASSVVVVTLPVEGKGADVSDYLAGGATLADLEALVADIAAAETVEAVPDVPKPMAATGYGMPLTDLGNAERLLRTHGNDLRYCVAWKSWLVWTGTHWERDAGDHEVRRRSVETILDLTNVAAVDFSPDLQPAQRTALGVPRATVLYDFMLSQRYFPAESEIPRVCEKYGVRDAGPESRAASG